MKLVQVKKNGKNFRVVKYGSIYTPPGTIENGFIVNPEALGKELGKLVGELGLIGKKTVANVLGQQVYTRLMTMPQMKEKELRQAALFQASSFLPISIEEITADIFPVRLFEDEEGKKAEVFFIAVRKNETENLFEACEQAGLKLIRVEIGAVAVSRVYGDYFDDNEGKVVAIFNIGANRSFISVYNNEVMNFLGFIPFGCSTFYRQAGPDHESGFKLEDVDIDNERASNMIRELGTELRRSIDYYEMQNAGRNIQLIVVCGGGSRIAGIADSLASVLNHKVVTGRLSRNIILPQINDKAVLSELHHDFPAAIGLALRGAF